MLLKHNEIYYAIAIDPFEPSQNSIFKVRFVSYNAYKTALVEVLEVYKNGKWEELENTRAFLSKTFVKTNEIFKSLKDLKSHMALKLLKQSIGVDE